MTKRTVNESATTTNNDDDDDDFDKNKRQFVIVQCHSGFMPNEPIKFSFKRIKLNSVNSMNLSGMCAE